jgi:hypothetical protein
MADSSGAIFIGYLSSMGVYLGQDTGLLFAVFDGKKKILWRNRLVLPRES